MRKPKAKKAKAKALKPAPEPVAEVPAAPPPPPVRSDRVEVLMVKDSGPVKNLALVQFADWKVPGIAITADKARQHAMNLRTAAGLLGPDHYNYATYLRGFAEQLSPMAVPGKLEDA